MCIIRNLISFEFPNRKKFNIEEKMKRISTSILLLLMLMLSMHPILSMHFCEGELESLNLLTSSKSNVCCMTSEVGDVESAKFAFLKHIESDNSCCTTTNIEVVTDNFTADSSQSIQSPTESTNMLSWFVVNYLINLTTPDVTVKPNFNFPTYGSYLKTLDFLSLICVYRL